MGRAEVHLHHVELAIPFDHSFSEAAIPKKLFDA